MVILPVGTPGTAIAAAGPAVTGTISIGGNPTSLDVNPRNNLLYVTNPNQNTVALISTVTNHVAGTVALPNAGAGPMAIGVDQRNGLVFVGASSLPKLYVIGAVAAVSVTLPLAAGSTGLTIGVDPVTESFFASQGTAQSVRVFGIGSDASTATISIGGTPAGSAVNENTHRTYVANASAGTVVVIDNATDSVIGTVPVGLNPTGVAVNPVTNRIYVTNAGSGTVSVIDGVANAVVGTIKVGANPPTPVTGSTASTIRSFRRSRSTATR
jgi:YVTN family beta-propeller protein